MTPLRSFSPERDQAGRKGWTVIRSVQDLGAGVGLRFVVELEAGKPTVRLGLVLRVIEALGGSLYLGDLGMPIRQDDGNDDR